MAHSLAGIFLAQALFLVVGLAMLWTLRGWPTTTELVRLGAFAYVVGVAVIGVEATLVLVAGGSLGLATVLGVSAATVAVCVAIALRLRRPLPRRFGLPRPRRDAASLAAAGFALLTLVVLVGFFRAARLQGNVAFDAWAFWVPKAKAIYFFGGLDEQLFRTLPGPSYPLFVPAVQAIDFHFMGSADQTTLALQYWFLFVGFVLAVWGLLRPLVAPVLIWPVLALVGVLPELDKRLLSAQADWPLDILFALAGLCLALWLVTREPWLLGGYTILLAAVMATKREGQLLTACLVAGGLAATAHSIRRAWPRIVLLAGLAYSVNVPWRIWWTSRNLLPDTPDSGVGRLSATASRIGPSVRIVLELLFSYGLWSIVVPICAAAAVALLVRRDYGVPGLYLVTSFLALVGFTWILWSIPSLPLDTSALTPIPRAVGSLVLLSVALAPLLFAKLAADDPKVLEGARRT